MRQSSETVLRRFGFEYDGFKPEIDRHCFYHPGFANGISMWLAPDSTWSLLIWGKRCPPGDGWKKDNRPELRRLTKGRGLDRYIDNFIEWTVRGTGRETLISRLESLNLLHPAPPHGNAAGAD